MKLTTKDKNTFQKVVDCMQRMNQNGVYYSIMEDLETVSHKILIAEILEIFSRWKIDLHSVNDPKYKAICNFEIAMVTML